jgi:hypothetical protein
LGSKVVNQGRSNNIAYADDQERIDFVSDGSSNTIGPLTFIPTATNLQNWFRESIPSDFYQCNDIEVFVGGRRLVKNPRQIFDSSEGAYSPDADKQVEAEFSVNGINKSIRLTEVPSAGTRITIIKKIGSVWYDNGLNTATTGISLIDNTGPIPKFIQEKTSELPE